MVSKENTDALLSFLSNLNITELHTHTWFKSRLMDRSLKLSWRDVQIISVDHWGASGISAWSLNFLCNSILC